MDSLPENAEQLLELLRDAAARAGDSGHRFRLDNGQLARVKFERNVKSDRYLAQIRWFLTPQGWASSRR
jgi:hypothetical protein